MTNDTKLNDLTQAINASVSGVATKVKSVRLLTDGEVTDEVLFAIAGAVTAYAGYYEGEKRQARFASTPMWTRGTRIAQLNHLPVR